MAPNPEFGFSADDDIYFSLIEGVEEAIQESLSNEREVLEETLKKTPEPAQLESATPHPEQPSARTIADRIESRHGNNYAYVTSTSQWWAYGKKTGCWSECSLEDMQALVQDEFDSFGPNGSFHQIKQAVSFLQMKLRRKEDFKHPANLIGFKNGVLDKTTKRFEKHSPRHRILSTLPYEYEPNLFASRKEMAKDIQPILSWLLESVGGSSEDYALVEILLRYLAAVIFGYTHYQKYLEVIGTAGSGKGTFLRLATALVGKHNSASTQLNTLERSQFGMAKLTEAALVKITDAEKWQGDCQRLLAFIGQDDLEVERKGIQQRLGEDSCASGLLILAGERAPTFSAGGMQRRRITIPFMNAVSESQRTDLLTVTNDGSIKGVLAPYVPKLFQFLLTYTEEEIAEYVQRTNSLPRYVQIRANTILETNPIARFLEDKCFYHPNLDPDTGLPAISVQMGVKKWDATLGDFQDSEKHLYPAFCKWCRENGIHELSLEVFKKNLIELMNEQLKLPITAKRCARSGKSMVYGLGLRSFSAIIPGTEQTLPRLLTETYLQTQVEVIAATNKKAAQQPTLRMEERGGRKWFDFAGYYAEQERIAQELQSDDSHLPSFLQMPEDPEDLEMAETPSPADTEDPEEGYQFSSKKEDIKKVDLQDDHVLEISVQIEECPSYPSVSAGEPVSDDDSLIKGLQDDGSRAEEEVKACPSAPVPPASSSIRQESEPGDEPEDEDEDDDEIVDRIYPVFDNEDNLQLSEDDYDPAFEEYIYKDDDY